MFEKQLLDKKENHFLILKFLANGNVGNEITEINVSGVSGEIRVYRDINRNSRLDEGDIFLAKSKSIDRTARFLLTEKVLPGYKKIKDLRLV